VAAFWQTLERFRKANGGNVALIFAITLVPLLAATGTVVDFTRAAMARSQMQDALDATALFLSRNT
jgi:Flp pilus assembly protein TadG